MGKNVAVTQDPKRMRPGKSEVERLLCDNSKAHEIVGWKPEVDSDEGLRLTIEWIRENLQKFKRIGKYTV